MKTLFTFLIILAIAALVGVIAYQDNGYVLIGRGVTTIEMSLALFIFLQISLYLLIAFSLRIIKRTWALPDFIKNQHNSSKTRKARETSKQGLIALAQGQWKKAEKILLKHIDNSETPLLNYLSAARAAQKLNEPERRDHYLALAHKSMPDADFAVELTQAELQLAHGQFEQSLATLIHLRSISPKHSHVLHLLAQLYEKLNSWNELQALLPDLKKYKISNAQELYRLQKCIFHNLLNREDNLTNDSTVNNIETLWQSLPKELKNDHDIIIDYAKKLIQLEMNEEAGTVLKNSIKHQWSLEMVYLYGLVTTSHLQLQLDFAESLIKQHAQNPVLLLTLGRLCLNLELWGKAQAYFEASLGISPMAETYKELALLMDKLDKTDQANQYCKNGLLLATEEISFKKLSSLELKVK